MENFQKFQINCITASKINKLVPKIQVFPQKIRRPIQKNADVSTLQQVESVFKIALPN